MSNPFGDREVITREPAYLTKAFGKKLAKPRAVSGVNECLLSDGTTVFECVDNDFVSEDIERVIRHRSKHADSSRKYPADVVAKVLQYREIERARSIRGWSERVAIRLNKEKIPRPDGSKWLAAAVASLCQSHAAEYEKAVNGVATVATVTALVTNPETPKVIGAIAEAARSRLFGLDPDLTARMAETTDPAMTAKIITDLVGLLAMQAKPCQHSDYDELKAKAAMLDQMRTFMGEGK